MNNGSAVPGVSSIFQGISKTTGFSSFFSISSLRRGMTFRFLVLEYSCLHLLISILLKLYLSVFIELKKPGDIKFLVQEFLSL